MIGAERNRESQRQIGRESLDECALNYQAKLVRNLGNHAGFLCESRARGASGAPFGDLGY